jgi:hypothetical protein
MKTRLKKSFADFLKFVGTDNCFDFLHAFGSLIYLIINGY